MKHVLSCPSCSYPIGANAAGDVKTCAQCGTTAIAETTGVTIPSPALLFFLGLGLGVFLGPAISNAARKSQSWVARKAS